MKPLCMRWPLRPGAAKQGQVTGAFAEHAQTREERPAIERFDRGVVGMHPGPVDATVFRRLHHWHCPDNVVRTQVREPERQPV